MLRSLAVVCVAALVSACSTAPVATTQSAPRQFPLRDFFANPERAYFRLSEDGRTLGFMQPAVGAEGSARRLNVFVQKLEGSRPVGEPRQLTRESARDV